MSNAIAVIQFGVDNNTAATIEDRIKLAGAALTTALFTDRQLCEPPRRRELRSLEPGTANMALIMCCLYQYTEHVSVPELVAQNHLLHRRQRSLSNRLANLKGFEFVEETTTADGHWFKLTGNGREIVDKYLWSVYDPTS